jgi:selenocysteine lyase/cysteine desulfurase
MACFGSNAWRHRIVGVDEKLPLLNGELSGYINFDNAASTPPFREVLDAVLKFIPVYSNVHRGTGYKSRVSTAVYEQAHKTIARFVGADLNFNTVIFGKNTTEAVNKLSYRYPFRPDSVIVSTMMEHHSNDLPWRRRATVVRARVTEDGRLDEDHLEFLLEKYSGRVDLLTVSGASNVTGFVQPIHRLARKAHAQGAEILVDAAQLAPHQAIDMRPDADPEHLDYVALSAHKMYAPFGTGALIGRRDIFLMAPPEFPGGGTVELVTPDDVTWANLPDREEAGTPNVVGALAMAVAAETLMDTGMENVHRHEQQLTVYALAGLQSVPGITIYGGATAETVDDKIGVISFNLRGIDHALVAAILGYEGGIGVRNGCFCAQPYVMHLLKLTASEQAHWRKKFLAGDKSQRPGMVRVSFGAYNNEQEVDALVEMLHRITQGDYMGEYRADKDTGEYVPVEAACLVAV